MQDLETGFLIVVILIVLYFVWKLFFICCQKPLPRQERLTEVYVVPPWEAYQNVDFWRSNHGGKKIVALDCEHYTRDGRCVAHKVAIVDYNYNVIYSYDQRQLFKGIYLLQKEVEKKVQNCVLVGHDLKHDLKALNGLVHPDLDIRDTCYVDVFQPKNGRQPKLKILAEKYLHMNIQMEDGAHDPAEDAIAAMKLYRLAIGKL